MTAGLPAEVVRVGAQRPDYRGQSVLVVDDDPTMRKLLEVVLRPLGANLVVVDSGESALAQLLSIKPAAIVLDVSMPGIDGFETAELVRSDPDLSATPIIFLTGKSGDSLKRGYELGAVDFLLKPVTREVLFAKVQALLDLDRSYRLLAQRSEELHTREMQEARAAQDRDRQEIEIALRREKANRVFAEASIDLAMLEQLIAGELSEMTDASCAIRLRGADLEWGPAVQCPVESSTLARWLTERIDSAETSEELAEPAKADWPPGQQTVLWKELRARGEVLGILVVASDRPLTKVQLAMFSGIVPLVALAISNARLFHVQAEYGAVMQASGEAIVALNRDGEIRRANRAAGVLFDLNDDDLPGCPITDFVQVDQRERLQSKLSETVRTRSETSMEATISGAEGCPVEVIFTLTPIPHSQELQVAAIVHDLTEIRRAEAEIRFLASHDPLTGLANRSRLAEEIDRAISLAGRTGLDVGVIYIDLNNFKQVNDELGHPAGDALLRWLAEQLIDIVREHDVAARVGGDEFVIMLPGLANPTDTLDAAKRIAKELGSRSLELGGEPYFAAASLGVSSLAIGNTKDREELLTQADIAMFEAKRLGEANACRQFEPLMDPAVVGSLNLASELRRALDQGDIHLVYAPIVDTARKELYAVEVSFEWKRDGVVIPRSTILRLAEDEQTLTTINEWFLRIACAEAGSWPSSVGLHVPTTRSQMLHPDFLFSTRSALSDGGLNTSRLCLDLGERTFLDTAGSATIAAVIKAVQADGIWVAIEDFGVEYASMFNLMRLKPDLLKIDEVFTSALPTDPRAIQVTRAQISVAASLDVPVIARGVDTTAKAATLVQMGCTLHRRQQFPSVSGLAGAVAAMGEMLLGTQTGRESK